MSTIQVPALKGSLIVSVHEATKSELKQIGVEHVGHNAPLVLELNTGVRLVALRDAEANGYGVLLGLFGKNQFYPSAER